MVAVASSTGLCNNAETQLQHEVVSRNPDWATIGFAVHLFVQNETLGWLWVGPPRVVNGVEGGPCDIVKGFRDGCYGDKSWNREWNRSAVE